MQKQKKVVRTLEKKLLGTLLDPPDSDQRRRYIKRWIYGEGIPPEIPKSFRERLRAILK